MPSASGLFYPVLGLLLFASVAVAQSPSVNGNISQDPTSSTEALAPSATMKTSASEDVIQPTMVISESLSASAAEDFKSQSSGGDIAPSSPADGVTLSISETESNSASTMGFSSVSSSPGAFAISASEGSSVSQSTVIEIQPSASVSPTGSFYGDTSTVGMSAGSDSLSASFQSTVVSSLGSSDSMSSTILSSPVVTVAAGSATSTISISSDVTVAAGSGTISPSPTASLAPSASAGAPVAPVPADDGSSPTGQGERQKGGGGGGGMSSGAKAAVGIFVTLALVGLIALVVVLYRRNYFNPRNIKALVKGGVRYQTHDDSMSYNDEGMLILPDRR